MATFSTYAEVLRPDHVMMKMYRAGVEKQHPGLSLQTSSGRPAAPTRPRPPLTDKFRGYIREVAELTEDDELLRIAELSEVPVSLENFRRVDPQTRVVMFSRLDVSRSLGGADSTVTRADAPSRSNNPARETTPPAPGEQCGRQRRPIPFRWQRLAG